MAHKQILIVEDDAGIRSCLQEVFEGDGYPVLFANHGQAALDMLAQISMPLPGLILLDLMMPVMDGPTFLLELQRIHPKIYADIPIFLITAGGDSHRLAVKATGFLKKPFDLDELYRLATQYCDHETILP